MPWSTSLTPTAWPARDTLRLIFLLYRQRRPQLSCRNLPYPASDRNVHRQPKRRLEGTDVTWQARDPSLAADTDANLVYKSDLVGYSLTAVGVIAFHEKAGRSRVFFHSVGQVCFSPASAVAMLPFALLVNDLSLGASWVFTFQLGLAPDSRLRLPANRKLCLGIHAVTGTRRWGFNGLLPQTAGKCTNEIVKGRRGNSGLGCAWDI